MVRSKQHSLIIVGSGITGLSTAYHLEKLGIKNIAIAGPSPSQSSSHLASGLVSGGTVDNFSRLIHAHGLSDAQKLWKLGDNAFDYSFKLCKALQVASCKSARYRLITSDHEMTESKIAVNQLNSSGFAVEFLSPTEVSDIAKSSVHGIQRDSERGGFINPHELLQQLNNHIQCERIPKISNYRNIPEGLELTDIDEQLYNCELMVLANHLHIPDLLPSLDDSIISFADQWIEIETIETDCPSPWNKPGTFYSANHTYEWGVRLASNKWRIGGGRYLRKFAGIEATSADFSDKISQHLIKKFLSTFTFVQDVKMTTGQAFLDCRPCDELPLIGPMFGEQRILLSTGYMGSSLTLGVFAGYCLAELIAHGRCEALPRFIWPERLRSLPSTL